jgi:ATP-dependent Zn protease
MDEKQTQNQAKQNGSGAKNGKPMKRFEVQMQFNPRTMIFWFLIALLFVPYLFSLLSGNAADRIALSQVVNDVRDEKVQKIQVTGQEIQVQYKDGAKKFSRKEDAQNLADVMQASGVDPASVETTIITPSVLSQFFGLFDQHMDK